MKIIQIGSFPLNISHIQGGVEASVWGLSSEQAKDQSVIVIDIPRTTIIYDYKEQINGMSIFRFSAKGENNYSYTSFRPHITTCGKGEQQRERSVHMSSAANHRARSHRSYSNKRSTMGKIQSKAAYRNARIKQAMTLRQRLAAAFAGLRKPKESKTDKA